MNKNRLPIYIIIALISISIVVDAGLNGIPWQMLVLFALLGLVVLLSILLLTRSESKIDLKAAIDLGLPSSLIAADEMLITMTFDIHNLGGSPLLVNGTPLNKEKSENVIALTSRRLLFLYARVPQFSIPSEQSFFDSKDAGAGKTLVKGKSLQELLSYGVFQIPYEDIMSASLEHKMTLKLTTTQGQSYGYLFGSGYPPLFTRTLEEHLDGRFTIK